jgi:hypothetical protein
LRPARLRTDDFWNFGTRSPNSISRSKIHVSFLGRTEKSVGSANSVPQKHPNSRQRNFIGQVPKLPPTAGPGQLSKVVLPTFVTNERVGPVGSTALREAARGNGSNSDSSAGLVMCRTANRCLLLLRGVALDCCAIPTEPIEAIGRTRCKLDPTSRHCPPSKRKPLPLVAAQHRLRQSVVPALMFCSSCIEIA